MAECECLKGCPFFNDRMSNMPSLANVYKKQFCLSDFNSCARHMVFKAKGKEHVPLDLFPNEADKAKQIISEHS